MINICQNVRDHMGTYYQLMKKGFVPRCFRELNDLLYDESENEVDFFKEINTRN